MTTEQTQREIKENDVVCFECGRKYLTDKQKNGGGYAVTAHEGICCECGQLKTVTAIRHYNYLNPELIDKHLKQ